MFDLRNFDDEFEPAAPASTFCKPEEIPDGIYDFCIVTAVTKQPKGNFLVELGLRIESAGKCEGMVVQHAMFMNDLDSVKRVGRDLKTLGFDTDNWKKANGRPFSVEFEKALKILPGIRVRGRKKTNEKKEQGKVVAVYHNLYLDKRLATDGKPEFFGAGELNAVAPTTNGHTQADEDDPFRAPVARTVPPEEEIPF